MHSPGEMILSLLFWLLLLEVASAVTLPEIWNAKSTMVSNLWQSISVPTTLAKRDGLNYNPDGTPFLWLPFDEYSGKTFYEYVGRYAHFCGLVTYLKASTLPVVGISLANVIQRSTLNCWHKLLSIFETLTTAHP